MQFFSWSFKYFCDFASTLRYIYFYYFCSFRNGHFHKVIWTLAIIVKLNVENGNVVLMLFNVMQISVEIRNVDLMLFDVVSSTLRRRINQKTTLKQPWNVCWNFFILDHPIFVLDHPIFDLILGTISCKSSYSRKLCMLMYFTYICQWISGFSYHEFSINILIL